MKTKLYMVHVRAYELACWYFGNRGNTKIEWQVYKLNR